MSRTTPPSSGSAGQPTRRSSPASSRTSGRPRGRAGPRCGSVMREDRPPDRRVELDDPALDAVRPAKRLAEAADEVRRLVVGAGAERDDRELVAAHSCHRVAGPDDRLEAPRDRPQHVVARLVTPDVVDALEAVQIHDEQCKRLGRSARASERLLEAVVQKDAVGQAGERILQRQPLCGDALGDEEMRSCPSEERKRSGHRQRRRDAAVATELEPSHDPGHDHETGGGGPEQGTPRRAMVEPLPHYSPSSRALTPWGRRALPVLQSSSVPVMKASPFWGIPITRSRERNPPGAR